MENKQTQSRSTLYTIPQQKEFAKEGLKGCQKCGEIKPIDNFYNRQKKSGNKIITYKEAYCSDCCRTRKNKWATENTEKVKEYRADYHFKYYERDRPAVKSWVENNRERVNERCRINYRRKRNEDILWNAKEAIRGLIKSKISRKKFSTCEILGCDYETFYNYIESKFTEGMTWNNHGKFGWHLDHIIPLASAKTEEELYKLNHYTNFQPLWAEDNWKKSNKISVEWGNEVKSECII
jgi:hypothetical protein